MCKVKPRPSKEKVNAPQKHLHSRLSYLYQAATFLSQSSSNPNKTRSAFTSVHQGLPDVNTEPGREEVTASERCRTLNANASLGDGDVAKTQRVTNLLSSDAVGLSCYLLSHVRTVSMKSQIRLSSTMKNTICKRCNILLVPGSTSTTRLENKSRGSKKPWANVLIVTCNLCDTTKRLPIGAQRQLRRSERSIHSGIGAEKARVTRVEMSDHS